MRDATGFLAQQDEMAARYGRDADAETDGEAGA